MAVIRECHADDQLSRWYRRPGRRGEAEVRSDALAQLVYDGHRIAKEGERRAARKQNLGLALVVLATVVLLVFYGT